MKSEDLGNINKVKFRDKSRGYDYPCMMIEYKKGKKTKVYKRGSESDEWLRLFLSNEGDRPACRACIVDKYGHCSDISIGDFNNRDRIPKKMNDNLGCSHVIVNTNKGYEIFHKISDYIEFEKIKMINKSTVRPASVNGNRFNKKIFYEDVKALNTKELYSKYYPETIKIRLIRIIREAIYFSGMYSFIKILKQKRNKFKD